MILIIGGFAQGRLRYTLKKYGLKPKDVFDLEKQNISELKNERIIYHIEAQAEKWIKEGKNPSDEIKKLFEILKDRILITQETGCGLVPISHEERELRESIGRMNIVLAEFADIVERICCGIGMKLK